MARGSTEVDAVVVGSGPNGLAAAVLLARSGLAVHVVEEQASLGGGARSVDGWVDGNPDLRHDLCSAVHPMALASPFFRRFDLPARGVELCTPEVSYAQPLDGSDAALAYRDLARTVEHLGADGSAWAGIFGPLVDRADEVVALIMSDHRSLPRDLATAVRFGLRALEQGLGVTWDRRFSGRRAPALLTGVAAHGITPLPSIAGAGTALLLGTLAHATGWGVPRGGTQVLTDALVADLLAYGATFETGNRVTRLADLPSARAHLFDTTPAAAARILGDRVPAHTARALRDFRHGDAAAKVDLVLSGPVPWRNPEVHRAGTVHVGGTRAEMAAAEHAVHAGRHAEHPMVLLSDPAVSDPSRVAANGNRPLWTYAHVPAGSDRDLTEAVLDQVERYAPGVRDLVVASRAIPAAQMSQHNSSYVGGDIAGGAITLPRMLLGPVAGLDPYTTGVPGAYLCSSSVPPGPGVHGMGGWFAARRALAERFGIDAPPDLSPSARR